MDELIKGKNLGGGIFDGKRQIGKFKNWRAIVTSAQVIPKEFAGYAVFKVSGWKATATRYLLNEDCRGKDVTFRFLGQFCWYEAVGRVVNKDLTPGKAVDHLLEMIGMGGLKTYFRRRE
jgi:hypothetical protein